MLAPGLKLPTLDKLKSYRSKIPRPEIARFSDQKNQSYYQINILDTMWRPGSVWLFWVLSSLGARATTSALAPPAPYKGPSCLLFFLLFFLSLLHVSFFCLTSHLGSGCQCIHCLLVWTITYDTYAKLYLSRAQYFLFYASAISRNCASSRRNTLNDYFTPPLETVRWKMHSGDNDEEYYPYAY